MIVVQRRGEPATARMEAAVLGPAAAVAGVELPHLLLRVEGIAVGQPVLLVDGHPKAGVGHLERFEDALLEHCGEGLAFDLLDYWAQHDGSPRIETGRSTCRETVCQYVYICVVAEALKNTIDIH